MSLLLILYKRIKRNEQRTQIKIIDRYKEKEREKCKNKICIQHPLIETVNQNLLSSKSLKDYFILLPMLLTR